jgi:hypothetical protein
MTCTNETSTTGRTSSTIYEAYGRADVTPKMTKRSSTVRMLGKLQFNTRNRFLCPRSIPQNLPVVQRDFRRKFRKNFPTKKIQLAFSGCVDIFVLSAVTLLVAIITVASLLPQAKSII